MGLPDGILTFYVTVVEVTADTGNVTAKSSPPLFFKEGNKVLSNYLLKIPVPPSN